MVKIHVYGPPRWLHMDIFISSYTFTEYFFKQTWIVYWDWLHQSYLRHCFDLKPFNKQKLKQNFILIGFVLDISNMLYLHNVLCWNKTSIFLLTLEVVQHKTYNKSYYLLLQASFLDLSEPLYVHLIVEHPSAISF